MMTNDIVIPARDFIGSADTLPPPPKVPAFDNEMGENVVVHRPRTIEVMPTWDEPIGDE
jgi:hypothetical protein